MAVDLDQALARAQHSTEVVQHRAVLDWYQSRAGTTQPWPGTTQYQLEDGRTDEVRLASLPKGIYKPAWTDYAVSVRQSLEENYADYDPVKRADGVMEYRYHQEGRDPSARDEEYTNRGLMKCIDDQIPVGVFRKVSPKPNPQYEILGLMFVVEWSHGYFLLRSRVGHQPHIAIPRTTPDELTADLDEDMRDWALRCIAARRGQAAFRAALIDAYGGRCSITGCDAVEALEAAHISPYKGDHTNDVTNGLLLRADLHTLFDLG
jgi:putative restriction endonuclease